MFIDQDMVLGHTSANATAESVGRLKADNLSPPQNLLNWVRLPACHTEVVPHDTLQLISEGTVLKRVGGGLLILFR